MARKDPQQMSDHEILVELLEEKRRQDRMRYVKYAVWGIVLIALAVLAWIYVPKIAALYNELQAVSEQADQTMQEVSRTMDKINESLQQLQSDYDAVKSAGQGALESAAETLNGLLETLQGFQFFH